MAGTCDAVRGAILLSAGDGLRDALGHGLAGVVVALHSAGWWGCCFVFLPVWRSEGESSWSVCAGRNALYVCVRESKVCG